MGSFFQWKKTVLEGRSLPKTVWVYGDSDVFREEAIADARELSKVSEMDYSIVLPYNKDVFYSTMFRQAFNPDTGRLVVIREADRISDWDFLNLPTDNLFVFVSEMSDVPRLKRVEGEKEGQKKPFLSKMKLLLKCSKMSESMTQDYVSLMAKGISKAGVERVVTRSAADPKTIRDFLEKMKVFEGSSISNAVIDLLLPDLAPQWFADSLLFESKAKTAKMIGQVSVVDALAQVAQKLELLSDIAEAQSKRTDKSLSELTGLSYYVLSKLSPETAKYDFSRRAKILSLLSVLEAFAVVGVEDGVLESLIALW